MMLKYLNSDNQTTLPVPPLPPSLVSLSPSSFKFYYIYYSSNFSYSKSYAASSAKWDKKSAHITWFYIIVKLL